MRPEEIYAAAILLGMVGFVLFLFWKEILSFFRPDWFVKYYIWDKKNIRTFFLWNKHDNEFDYKRKDSNKKFTKDKYMYIDRIESYFWDVRETKSLDLSSFLDGIKFEDPEMLDKRQKIKNMDFWTSDEYKSLMKWITIGIAIGVVIAIVISYQNYQKVQELVSITNLIKDGLTNGLGNRLQ